MKTPICFNGKGNEVIAYCSLINCVFSWATIITTCDVIVDVRCTIFVGVKSTMTIGSKAVFGDKDIHSSASVAKEKVGDLLVNMCSTLQSNSYDSTPKRIVGYFMFIPTKAPKKMGT
jgi:hypothetical protein